MAEIDERYKRGKIYTIRCRYDDSLIYVGSTIDTLAKRMSKHRTNNTTLNMKVNGDWNNWYIELYESYCCNNKQELERREGQVIREIGTINRIIARRTPKEYKQDNKDKIDNYNKKWKEDNKEHTKESFKEYYENNREKLVNKSRKYYEENQDKILEKRKEIIKCNICNCEVVKCGLKRHQKTKKCMNYNLNNN